MSITNEDLQRAIDMAHACEADGYFHRVAAGDQRAASLFARLVAHELNPTGKPTDYGWLSKSPGESQVDGYAEDAICFGANPSDLHNVVDLVHGAGAPGAQIGGDVHERRANNLWVTPKALTDEEEAYLLEGSGQSGGGSLPYPGDDVWDAVGHTLFADYAEAHQAPNPLMGRWFGRTIWDATEGDGTRVLTVPESIAKHRGEWRSALGLPPA